MKTASAHLDTHVVCWLYAGLIHQLSETAAQVLEHSELRVCPAVELELDLWHQAKLIELDGASILNDLERRIGLQVESISFVKLARESAKYSFTQDPIDRLLCAHAALAEAPLLTKDAHLHAHFSQALW